MKNPATICRARDRASKKKIFFESTILVCLIALCRSASGIPAQEQEPGRGAQSQSSATELIRGLQSRNPIDREHAAQKAITTKPLPPAVVPVLLNSIRELESRLPKDENGASGSASMNPELGRYSSYVGPALANAGTPAIPQLSLALDDDDAVIRRVAVNALVRIAADSPAAWPVLISALANPHAEVPDLIEAQLPSAGGAPIAPLLLRSLKDSNPKIRGGSAVALSAVLGRYGAHGAPSDPPSTLEKYGVSLGDAVLVLAKALNDLDPNARGQTVDNLAGIGPPAKAAMPYVMSMLKDGDPNIRMPGIFFLEAMGPDAKVAMPDLIQCLNDPNRDVRMEAMGALGGLGPVAAEAVPDLAIALKSPDSDIAERAALVLANIDPGHAGVLPPVTGALSHLGQTDSAIKALYAMGSFARPAVPALEHLIATDDYVSERQAALAALVRIEGTKAVPALARVMNGNSEESVRTAAVTALGGLGSSSDRAIAALVHGFSNDSVAVRDAASDALSKLGRTAVPALIAALKSPQLYQRAWAVQTLSRIKPLPNDGTHALTLALRDKSEIIKTEAEAALNGDKVNAGDTIADQQTGEDVDIYDAPATGRDLASFEAGKTVPNTRTCSTAEIIASIPPDRNHQYPSLLKYYLPVAPSHSSAADANFLVTVHAAKEGMDRLAIWKKTGKTGAGKYQQLLVQIAASDTHFEEPSVFSSKVLVTGRGKEHYETALFVDLPLRRSFGGGEAVDDTVLVLDRAELRPVEIQPAVENSNKLRRGEWDWFSLGNSFSDNHLEFGFHLWEKDQCHACAGGADVTGTYKAIKEMHYDAQKKDWEATWKLVVDSAERKDTAAPPKSP